VIGSGAYRTENGPRETNAARALLQGLHAELAAGLELEIDLSCFASRIRLAYSRVLTMISCRITRRTHGHWGRCAGRRVLGKDRREAALSLDPRTLGLLFGGKRRPPVPSGDGAWCGVWRKRDDAFRRHVIAN